jgi:hypothetical protein
MFLQRPDRSTLRQGDVCVVRYLPCWDLQEAQTVSGSDESLAFAQLPVQTTKIVKHQGGILVAVCSQCCDLTNQKGRTGIAIAPIRPPLLSRRDQEARQRFSDSYRPSEKRWSWFHLFPLILPEEIGGGGLVAVDWSAITTMAPHGKAFQTLLDGKLKQLTADRRSSFRRKLSASFGRNPAPDNDRQAVGT